MSAAYDTIIPSMQPAGTVRWVLDMQRLIAYRLAECPVERATTYYVNYSAAGSAAGGGGTGSMADPFLVRSPDDFSQLITAYGASGNVCFKVHEDAVLRGNTGCAVNVANNVSITSYGPSGGKHVLSGFTVDDTTGWTNTTFGAYVKTFATTVNWVRLNVHPSIALVNGTETIFKKNGGSISAISIHATAPTITTGTIDGGGALTSGKYHGLQVGDSVILYSTNSTPALSNVYTVASVPNRVTFTVAATTTGAGTRGVYMKVENNSFAYDAVTDTLLVRIGANVSPVLQTIEVCQATGKGYYVSIRDGCRVDRFIAIGWGMEDDAGGHGSPQNYAAHSYISGSQAVVWSNAYIGYTGHHAGGQLSSGLIGGICTMYNVDTGLVRTDSLSAATNFVGYAASGHEWIDWECTAVYGGLPDITRGSTSITAWDSSNPRVSVARYVHAAGGSDTFKFALSWKLRTKNHTYGCKANSIFGNAPAYTNNRGNLASYKAFDVGQVFEGGAGTFIDPTALYTCFICADLRCRVPAYWTNNAFFQAGVPMRGVYILCKFGIDYTDSTASGTNFLWLSDTSGDMYADFVYCGLYHTGQSDCGVSFDPRAVAGGNRSQTSRWFRCVWATDVSTAIGIPQPCISTDGAPEGVTSDADASVTGGIRDCGFYKNGVTVTKATAAGYQGYGSSPGCLDLNNLPGIDTVPTAGGELYRPTFSAVLPFSVEWFIDANGNLKRLSTQPALGPNQPDSRPLIGGGYGVLGILDIA